MEEEWRIYLRDNAPELYKAMLSSVQHQTQWRDELIKELRKSLLDLVCVLDKRHHGRMPDEVQKAYDAARSSIALKE